MSDSDPIPFRQRPAITPTQPIVRIVSGSAASGVGQLQPGSAPAAVQVSFNRIELNEILNVYGRMVASGDWRDYAMDFGREKAVFSVFRRTTEYPLFRIEKSPKLARKQGAYSVLGPQGQVLKRGTELSRVLAVFDSKLKPVG